MSTEHHSQSAAHSLSSMYKVFAAIALALTMLFTLALPTAAGAADSGMLSVDTPQEEARSPIPDAFGRDTPRLTVQGFIGALSQNDFLLASNYLNLSKSDNPTTMVRQFKQALDSGGRFLPDLQISNVPEGNLTDQLPPSQEKVGTININDKSVPLMLERVVSDKGKQYWQFSADTLSSIPEVLEDTEPTLISQYSFESLEDEQLFGYQLADLAAAIILVIGSFLLTYIVVWVLYHLLRLAYPRVRGIPLPMPDKVILPLSIVIMSMILSEVMIYAGVSVTLREPINRFTEVASWLAVTWLLLRIIDAIFTRAVNLSYRKNHTERVSILGLLRKVVKALLLIFAVIVIFGNLGFDLTTGIAALGVGGLALALGAQKTIENLVGSVVVVADSPVRIGDYCKFGDQEGTVIDIGIRSSRVRTLNRTVVTVPNGDFSSMQIENFTSRDMFHFLHNLYIKRNADIDVVFKMVKDLDSFLNEHELTNKEWNQANILELRQDCYIIQLRGYVNSVDVIEFYGKQDILLVDILNLVKKYKVEHALPTQQLIVHQEELEQQFESNNDDETVEAIDTDKNSKEPNQLPDEKTVDTDLSVSSSADTDKSLNTVSNSKPSHHRNKQLTAFKLAKRKFKRAHKIPTLSMWNQPWHKP
ncbi:mechanosensitive ion channel family protein [Psychrobacter sp. T6-1]|uniref:mechanosensitive ion channel family protein n=1 Tax=Psychrobacter sp. T6-1 TaxID=3457447 RepID=UPI003FD0BB1A